MFFNVILMSKATKNLQQRLFPTTFLGTLRSRWSLSVTFEAVFSHIRFKKHVLSGSIPLLAVWINPNRLFLKPLVTTGKARRKAGNH
jgi:hypothetical protein